MEVKLIAYTQPVECVKQSNPLSIVEECAAVCYDSKPTESYRIAKSCMESGHQSPFEHISFTFHVSGVSRACYDSKTEILTKDGWKFFKDINENEEVATLNQEDNSVEFNKIDEKIEYLYSGEMHNIKSQCVDLRITSNHNLYFRKQDSVLKYKIFKTYLMPSQDITCSKIMFDKRFNFINAKPSETIKIPDYKYSKKTNNGKFCERVINGPEINRKDFYTFLAWYISDGSTYYDEKEGKFVVSICQSKTDRNIKNGTIERIIQSCKNIGVNPNYDGNNIKFTNRPIGSFLKKLGKSYQKVIPFDIFTDFDKELATIFLNEYFMGDGSVDKNGCKKISTSSEKLANQIYNLCFIAGWSCKLNERYRDKIGENIIIKGNVATINHPSFIINVSQRKRNFQPFINLKKQRTIECVENEPVYCVNVKNHIVFVRRNGVALWCGNCLTQLSRHRHISLSVRSQRYCKEENFESVVPNFKHFSSRIKFVNVMDYIANEYGGLLEYENPEDARAVLPNACCTELYMTANARALIEMSHLRLCNRAQAEIRNMFVEMKKEVSTVAPEIADYMRPKCEINKDYPFCTEKKCCGKHKTLKEVYKDDEVQS